MDFESRSLTVECVENNDSVNPPVVASGAHGQTADEWLVLRSSDPGSGNGVLLDDQIARQTVDVENVRNLTPCSRTSSIDPPTSKGYGLRKWRRIRRDVVKDPFNNSDDSKALKRGLSISQSVNRPSSSFAADPLLNSEDSAGSVNMLTDPYTVPSVLVTTSGSNSEPLFFAPGVDSENSDDQSSRSSTAASAPRLRHNHPHASGHGKEKNKGKNTSGKNFSASVPRMPEREGKEYVEGSKKARGERIKDDSENSHSSIESNSMIPNFVFLQGAYSVEKHGNVDENGDDINARVQYFEEVNANYNDENAGNNEDHLPCESMVDFTISKKEENGIYGEPSKDSKEGNQLFQETIDTAADTVWYAEDEHNFDGKTEADLDPLADSLRCLQSLQEALETELHKFGEIGTQNLEGEIDEPSSSEDNEVVKLTEKVKDLELRLIEADNNLKLKNSTINALEDSLNSVKKDSIAPGNMHGDGEIEVDNLFMQKLEAEVSYLAISSTLHKRSRPPRDSISPSDQPQSPVEVDRAIIKKLAEQRHNLNADIFVAQEVTKLQGKMFKMTSCFFVQVILLISMALLLIQQLDPHPVGVLVPT